VGGTQPALPGCRSGRRRWNQRGKGRGLWINEGLRCQEQPSSEEKEDEQRYISRHRVFRSVLCLCVNQSHVLPIPVQTCTWPVLTALPGIACKRQQCEVVQFKATSVPARDILYLHDETKQTNNFQDMQNEMLRNIFSNVFGRKSIILIFKSRA